MKNKFIKLTAVILVSVLSLSLFNLFGGDVSLFRAAAAEAGESIGWTAIKEENFTTNYPTNKSTDTFNRYTGFLFHNGSYDPNFPGSLINDNDKYYGFSAAVIGYDYATNDFSSAVVAEKGVTYRVSFKYKALKRNDGKSGLEEYISVALVSDQELFTTNADGTQSKAKVTIDGSTSAVFEKVITFAKGATPNFITSWTDGCISVTVPEDADLSANKYFALYVSNHRARFQIDDVKIERLDYFENGETTNNPVHISGKTKFNDYQNITNTASTAWGGGKKAAFATYSGDMSPRKEKNKSNDNITLSPNGASYLTRSAIVPGFDYLTENADATLYGLTARPGATYRISFDCKTFWRTSGQPALANEHVALTLIEKSKPLFNSNGEVEVRVEDVSPYYQKLITIDEGSTDLTATKAYDYENDEFTDKAFNSSFTNYSITVTIPENMDVSTYNIFALYARCSNVLFHFDNIKIEDITPTVFADYNIDGAIKTVWHQAGKIALSDLTSGDKSLMLFADAQKTAIYDVKAFNNSVELGKLNTTTIYGEYERSDIAYVLGDANCDGNLDDLDTAELRRQLLGYKSTENRCNFDDDVCDILDLVRIDKILAVPGTSSEYGDVVFNTENENLINEIEQLNSACTGDDSANTISLSVDETLGTNEYLVKINDDGSVAISGKDEDVLAAAVATLRSYIVSGINIDTSRTMHFIYNK